MAINKYMLSDAKGRSNNAKFKRFVRWCVAFKFNPKNNKPTEYKAEIVEDKIVLYPFYSVSKAFGIEPASFRRRLGFLVNRSPRDLECSHLAHSIEVSEQFLEEWNKISFFKEQIDNSPVRKKIADIIL